MKFFVAVLVCFAATALAVANQDEQLVLSQDSCGCLHLTTCACRPAYQTPELRSPQTQAPAVKQLTLTQDACGCLHLTECPCRAFVTPEYKEAPKQLTLTQDACGCLHLSECACRSSSAAAVSAPAPSKLVVTQDSCGCLHLSVCPCKPQYTTPEFKAAPETVQPELKKNTACGQPTCGSEVQIVTVPAGSSCGCEAEPICGCRAALPANSDVAKISIVKPITASASPCSTGAQC